MPFSLFTCLALTTSIGAQAQLRIGAQVDGALLTQRPTSGGVGLTGSLGYEIPIGGLSLAPELTVGHSWFANRYSTRLLRAAAGVRLTLSSQTLAPFVFAHVGWGYANGLDFDAEQSDHGVAIDGGIGVRYAATKNFALGVQVAYNVLDAAVESSDPAHWLSLGLQATFTP